MFYVGQKVECINTDGWNAEDYANWSYSRKGDVCTIEGFDSFEDCGLTLILEEYRNHEAKDWNMVWGKCSFRASRFRPLVEKKTDISIFTEMLTSKELEQV